MFKALGQRDTLFVKELLDEKTFLAFDNIADTYVIESNELNAYLAANFRSIVIEKAVWETLVGEAK
jgi:large subunit ribosomal protein L4